MATANLMSQNQLLAAFSGARKYLGTISATTGAAQTQATTAVPFAIPAGTIIMVQPTVACYAVWRATGGAAVTAAQGEYIDANERQFIRWQEGILSVLGASATVDLKVFELF
jgi:hypothetical protein